MSFFLRTTILFLLFTGFSCPTFGQENIAQQLHIIEKTGENKKIIAFLTTYYQKLLKDKTLPRQEEKIVDLVIDLAIQEEDNNNSMMAFYIMNSAYEIIYPSLAQSKPRKNIIYYYAYYLMSINENKKAIELLKEKNVDTQNTDLKSLTLLAKLYIGEGEYEEAIDCCQKGLSLINFDKNNSQYLGLMTNKIHCFVSLKKHKEVLIHSNEIKSNIKNQPFFKVHYFLNLGHSYRNEKKYEEARANFKKNLPYNKGTQEALLFDEYNIALTYQEEKLYDKSVKLFDEIIKKLIRDYATLRTTEVANVYKSQAKNYYLKKEFIKGDNATSIALQMLNYRGSIKNYKGSKVALLDIITNKVNFNTNINDLSAHYLADSLIDQMRQEHTEEGSKLFWREKTHSFYENALETCFQIKNHEKAFYFMEKSRAILLLDALKDIDAKKILSPIQQATEQDLRYRTIRLQNKLSVLSEKDKNYNKTYQEIINAKKQYNLFIQSLEKSNPTYYQLKYNNKYLAITDLQKILKVKNQSFIEYFVGDSAVYALAITATRVDFKKINLQEYRLQANSFLHLAAQSPPHTNQQLKTFRTISYELYKLIFEPFQLPTGRVVVSQDNFFLPFSALVSSPLDNHFLLENYAFSYAYSANVLLKNQERSWSFKQNILGISPVKFSRNLQIPTLNGSDKVLEYIEQNYFSGKKLVNNQATKQNFITHASKYQLIQLFTHGKADSTGNEAVIYFQDSVLKLSELYQLEKLRANLVVLSACQTNLGQTATGEGVLSFARGFAFLNVPSTISTLWRVDNEATYEVTTHFYKYLSQGKPKDIALQMAQKEYLHKSNNIMPYFWSSMVLIGSVDELHNITLYLLIIFLSILFNIVVFMFWKRK